MSKRIVSLFLALFLLGQQTTLSWAQATECEASRTNSDTQSYHLSIDGKPVSNADQRGPAEARQCIDASLPDLRIQTQYDGLLRNPLLNLSMWPDAAVRDSPIAFVPYSNYNAFIQKWEVRVFKSGTSTTSEPLTVIEAPSGQEVVWTPDGKAGDAVQVVLRVYDAQGRFDETEPKHLVIDERAHHITDESTPEREKLIGYGKNHLLRHNIALSGGTVTINGHDLHAGSKVRVMGRDVPVDPHGQFVAQEILPSGTQTIEISLEEEEGHPVIYRRTLYTPLNEWFYIALGDLVVGENQHSGPAALVTADNEHYADKIYVDGRTAFYLKGKIKGDYLLTASADTQEGPARDLFYNFSSKDPQTLLRRIDPTQYYPVYGDDSTTVEDAPTRGKFYVRLEKGDSSVLWGNFFTHITGTDFAQIDRGLYGAHAHLVSPGTTSFGEKKSLLDIFAAEPGTLSSREEYLGTGGSLYYLRHQDITVGSERLRTEVRDKDSGIVLQTTDLVAGQDYDLDYIQGRVLLRNPLASTSPDGRLVYSSDLSGNPVYLVIRYEFAPGLDPLNDMDYGGRASQWLGNHVRVGATASRQNEEGTGRQDLLGSDMTLRLKGGTYLKGEVAQTDGPGPGATVSGDGGFAFAAVDQDTAPNVKANAVRVESAVQLADLAPRMSGTLNGYWQDRQGGFSAPGQLTTVDTHQWGALGNIPLFTSQLSAKYDETEQQHVSLARTLDGSLTTPWSSHWSTALGVRREERHTYGVGISSFSPVSTDTGDGDRTDGSARLTYQRNDWSLYGQGQGTAEKEAGRLRNDRYGGGGSIKLTSRLSLTGDASAGSGQLGARIGSDFRASDRNDLYINYLVESDRSGEEGRRETGTFVTGARSRYSDSGSVFGEERWITGTGPSGLTHAYGTDYSPSDRWTFGLTGEKGTLVDPTSGSLNRTAGSLSVGYHTSLVKSKSVLEGRYEQSPTDLRRTFLLRNDVAYQMNPAWRTLGKLNFSRSVDSGGSFQDGDFTEAAVGLGYRPVQNDWLNLLFKYTYFYNLPSPGQLDATGSTATGITQRSHILSLDETFDVTHRLSLGTKYAFRYGAIRESASPDDPFISSTAHLGIVHADWHLIKKWDALAEWRVLTVIEAKDTRQGALAGIYRYITDNVKLGAGYNFTDFSDDMTDQSYRSRGWFINAVAAF
jgi:hypothetical protein